LKVSWVFHGAFFAIKRKLNLQKINKLWAQVLDDQKRLEDARDEIDDQHKTMVKHFGKYSKVLGQRGK